MIDITTFYGDWQTLQNTPDTSMEFYREGNCIAKISGEQNLEVVAYNECAFSVVAFIYNYITLEIYADDYALVQD